jgi:sn-glycerol 3-phosphate transport system substrate-binding protein
LKNNKRSGDSLKKWGLWTVVLLLVVSMLSACGQGTASSSSGKKIELTWYFPVNVGGPITKTIAKMTKDFTKENPNIVIHPVYTGDYDESMTKVQTAVQGKKEPDLAVLLSTELYTLKDMNAIAPLDSLIKKDKDGEKYINDFYPAYSANSKSDGKIWSIPFQRSTVVLYYNKDLFKKAGLDPNKPPATWAELAADSKKLTIPNKQWGVEVPSTVSTYWIFQAFALQNGDNIMSSDGKKVYFNRPSNVEALSFMTNLAKKDKVMPTGTIDWKTSPTDFINQKTAMLYHTTGNLTNIKQNAKFKFGVAILPKKEQYGTPTGGGNFYVFKDIPEDHKKAAWKFIRWATTPERAAQWSIDTGYVATRKSAYETERMKKYIKGFPQAAVARDQLKYASAELSTHNNGKVYQSINDAVQAAVTQKKTPKQALDDAQRQAKQYLEPFQ